MHNENELFSNNQDHSSRTEKSYPHMPEESRPSYYIQPEHLQEAHHLFDTITTLLEQIQMLTQDDSDPYIQGLYNDLTQNVLPEKILDLDEAFKAADYQEGLEILREIFFILQATIQDLDNPVFKQLLSNVQQLVQRFTRGSAS